MFVRHVNTLHNYEELHKWYDELKESVWGGYWECIADIEWVKGDHEIWWHQRLASFSKVKLIIVRKSTW